MNTTAPPITGSSSGYSPLKIARDFVGYPLQRGAALVLVKQQFGAVEHGLGVSAFGC